MLAVSSGIPKRLCLGAQFLKFHDRTLRGQRSSTKSPNPDLEQWTPMSVRNFAGDLEVAMRGALATHPQSEQAEV